MNSENFFNHYIGDSKLSFDQAITAEQQVKKKAEKSMTSEQIETQKVMEAIQKKEEQSKSSPSREKTEQIPEVQKAVDKIQEIKEELKNKEKTLEDRVSALEKRIESLEAGELPEPPQAK